MFVKTIYLVCLLNENNLLVASKDKIIYWINLKFGIIIDKLIGHKDSVLAIKKVNDEKNLEIL